MLHTDSAVWPCAPRMKAGLKHSVTGFDFAFPGNHRKTVNMA